MEQLSPHFKAQIASYTIPTPEQAVGLCVAAQGGDSEARDLMVNSNLRLVTSIARRFIGHGLTFEELVQEGTIGLITAVDKFDTDRGIRFSTYATIWIRQACQRAIENTGESIRRPVNEIEKARRAGSARRKLSAELGREPTPAEIGCLLELPSKEVERLFAAEAQSKVSSLNASVGDDDTEVGDLIADPASEDDDALVNRLDDSLSVALSSLPERDRQVLEAHYGLVDGESKGWTAIGRELGFSAQRAYQIHNRAIDTLISALGEHE